MSGLRLFLLTFLIRPLMRKGPHQERNIQLLFLIIRKCWAVEFPENNPVKQNALLTDHFNMSRRYL